MQKQNPNSVFIFKTFKTYDKDPQNKKPRNQISQSCFKSKKPKRRSKSLRGLKDQSEGFNMKFDMCWSISVTCSCQGPSSEATRRQGDT